MTQLSEHRTNPWLAFAAGALAVAVIVVLWMAWSNGERAGGGMKLSLREAVPSLPSVPPMPQGPKLPDAPIPLPK